jgi:hypothetical protein
MPEFRAGLAPTLRRVTASDSGLLNCKSQDIYILLCFMANATPQPKREGAQVEARTTRAFPMLGRMVAFEAIAAGLNPDLVRFVEDHPSQDGPSSTICRGETGERANFHAENRAGGGRRHGAERPLLTNGKPSSARATFGLTRVIGPRDGVSCSERRSSTIRQDGKQRGVCDNQGRITS